MLTDTSTMSWRRINPGACANRLRFTTRTLLLVNSVMLTLFVTYLVALGLFRTAQFLWHHLFSEAW